MLSVKQDVAEGASGFLTEGLHELMAVYYSLELSKKVTRGMTDNALKCQFNGGTIPYGYRIDEQKHY